MSTKFVKISHDDISKHSTFFLAADSWLESFEILEDNRQKTTWSKFYVIPPIVAFILELFVKALVSNYDNGFVGKKYLHGTTRIIKDYKDKISILGEIYKSKDIMNLIKEYEKTIDTKFAETYVELDGSDQNKLVNLIYKLRTEICKVTGLK